MSRFADLVATSSAVAATRSRSEKVARLAEYLAAAAPGDVPCAVAFLTGQPRQGRIGVGWRTLLAAVDDLAPALEPTLTIGEVDAAIDALQGLGGAGSQLERRRVLRRLFGAATADEAAFLRQLLTGELRQGALAGVVTDAVARAAGIPLAIVRRGAMLAGDLPEIAGIALTQGRVGVEAIGLRPLCAIQPMLATTSTSVSEAVVALGPAPVSVEWKLDGIRIQAHRQGETVRLFTRNLNDVTDRLPEVAEVVAALPAASLVLDGEALGAGVWFFDVLHLDGDDLIDRPLTERLEALARVAGDARMPGLLTSDPDEAERFAEATLAAGHEGVMVKAAASPYEAGRRGAAWRKVKPVRTLDLVVLAAEWGHGRRRGRLSNLHLGARDDDGGGFVMVGKTFKGLTDALLDWQTEHLLAREERREGITVFVRPELVVEVALDGVLASTRYPGGVSLRFARIKRYRDDKTPDETDLITTVRTLGKEVAAGGASS